MSPVGDSAADAPVTLEVSLLGREYKVACREHERAELVEAVALLDRRMREIRDSMRVTGTERIAVMAALNLAHDLMRTEHAQKVAPTQAQSIDATATRRRIQSMQTAIDQVLAAE